VYAGIAAAGALCLYSAALRAGAGLWLGGLGVPTVVLSAPPVYQRLPRTCKDVLRCSMGICIGLYLCVALQAHLLWTAGGALVLFGFWKAYFARRRRRRAEACRGCPEYGRAAICSGCRIQAEAIRAYEAKATNLLLAAQIHDAPPAAGKR
jgi:hypothetical protein